MSITAAPLPTAALVRGRDAHIIKERVLQVLVVHAFKPTTEKEGGGWRTDREILAVEGILLIPCCIPCVFNIVKRNLLTEKLRNLCKWPESA